LTANVDNLPLTSLEEALSAHYFSIRPWHAPNKNTFAQFGYKQLTKAILTPLVFAQIKDNSHDFSAGTVVAQQVYHDPFGAPLRNIEAHTLLNWLMSYSLKDAV